MKLLNAKTLAGLSRTACAVKLLILPLMLTLPAAANAQYNYTTDGNTIGAGKAPRTPPEIHG